MTSKLIVNNIEADAGVSTITFGSEISASTFTGNLTGNVTGNLTGNVTGNVTSSSTSTFSSGLNVTGGSVGIGTDNPDQKLEIFAATGTNLVKVATQANSTIGIELEKTGATTQSWRIADGQTANGKLEFYDVTDTTTRMCLDGEGRLLVGNGNVSSQSTFYTGRIQVQGTNSSNSAILIKTNQNDSGSPALVLAKSRGTTVGSNTIVQEGDEIGIILFNGSDGTDIASRTAHIASAVDGVVGVNSMPGRLQFATTSSNSSTPTERMRISSNGNVLIGTPTANVPEAETLFHLNYPDTTGSKFRFTRAGGDTTFDIDYTNTSGDVVLGTVTDLANYFALGFKTKNTERMRITANGFTKHSNATSYFSINGNYHEFRSNDTNSSTLVVSHHGSSGGQYGIYVHTANDQNDSTRTFLYCDGASTARALIRSNGGLANYSANNANLCDEREKKNIEALDSTWGCLKNWELKKFHYNEDADTDDKRYGVIAQQVAPHCPEVITDWVKQRAEDAVLDDDGNVVTPAREEVTRMGVKEQQMMWMAIKALQEAQTRIETLEAKVAALENP